MYKYSKHISSKKLLIVYELAQQIAEVFQLNKNLIKLISTSILNQTALRSAATGFDLTKTNLKLAFYPKSFKYDLLKFKENLK